MEIILLIVNILVLIIVFIHFRKSNENKEETVDIDSRLVEIKEAQTIANKETREEQSQNFRQNREELANNFSVLKEEMLKRNSEQFVQQNDKFIDFERRIRELSGSNEQRIDKLAETIKSEIAEFNKQVDKNLSTLNEENTKQLVKMQETVDEKLQKTLENRISQAFSTVSERLEEVHKGLGEMKKLANDVDGLNKVLNNVKLRGVMGEFQLEQILEQILGPTLYTKNAQTKPNTNERVEFAVLLPGDENGEVLLPIDSKFPSDSYSRLIAAFDNNDFVEAELQRKELYKSVKKFAKDISDKYINPGTTTDFAIMFVPMEGLYAEILRDPALFHEIQTQFRVNITGPTTLAAFLSSLQMGFRTLAIQKRSSEVWQVLSEVKKEFSTFGDVLDRALNQLDTAKNSIKTLVGVRSRQMQKKLEKVVSYQTEPTKSLEESLRDNLFDENNDNE
ncbi:MAG: DNA recombination protein RmuC [Ignavibacteriae bacterium]|nr:DNA recombination protein RmuC [Ignavibacteriota bacterium]